MNSIKPTHDIVKIDHFDSLFSPRDPKAPCRMSKSIDIENAGVAREVDMFDKKKNVMETVGKIKPHKKKKEDADEEHKGHKKKKDKVKTDDNHEEGAPKASGRKHSRDHGDGKGTGRKHSKDHGDVTKGNKHSKDHSNEHGEAAKKTKGKMDDVLLSDLDSDDGKTEDNEQVEHDDDSHFRFTELIPPDEIPKAKMKEENKKVLESVRHVEDRLKSREQINLTMMSIELATLPSAHRFTKNSPWLKGAYGTSYSWVAEYEESEDGTKASWKNLRWSFNLERNEKDRNDLVITVCSKNLIIGRYVLGKEEFADIPDTKTGYFEVSGDVMSGIGPAGKIKVLFLKGKAERPHGPMKAVSAADSITAGGTLSALKQASLTQRKLYVKIISTAVMDLKSVHFLDVNCPFVAVEVGDWVGVSDTAHNAGMAARWNSLNWKFTVTADTGIHLMIHSKNVMIGRMHVSMEEISNLEPKANNIIEVIKSITDGKDVTGKVKINLLAESPQAGDTYNPEGSTLNNDLKTLDADGNVIEDPNNPLGGPSILSFNATGDLAPLKPFMRVPFQINVREVTVLDTVKAHYLRKNSLSVNVVCGAWGKATDELRASGSFAHWIDLKWKIPIKGTNNFRITAWSHGQSIGSANITVAELLDMPTDYEQNTEIFAKLKNAAGDIVGKVKLSCKYESLVSVVNDKIVAIVKEKDNTKDFAPNVGTEKLSRGVNFVDEDDPTFDFEEGSAANNVLRRRQELTLPLVATIKTIAVYDAISVHTFKKNTPQIRFICDRKSATTEAVKNAGAVASWTDLNWIMKIRADSHVVAILMSGEVTIGKVEISPKDLLSIPLNDDGLTEIKTMMKNDNTSTAKLHLIVDLKSLEEVLPPDTLPSAIGRGMQNGTPYSPYPQQLHPPGFGNTTGPLDALSVASWGQTLPQLHPPHAQYLPHMHHQQQHLLVQQQMIQQMMVQQQMQGVGNFASSSGSVFGTNNLPQRVPTIPAARPNTMPNTAYNNTISLANSYNPNALMSNSMDRSYNGPFYGGSPDGAHLAMGYDQRSVTWGSFAQTAPAAPQPVIFDRNLMSADNARKLGMSFNIAIQEIDLIDLKPVHKLVKNSPFVSAACGKWTASSTPIVNAGDTAFWTKLNWKSSCKSGGNLRLIVNSKAVIMGSVNFSTDDLLNAVSDDKGLRRVTANIVNEQQAVNGRIKVAYTMDIMTKLNSPNSPEQQMGLRTGSGSVGPGMSTRGGGSPTGFGAGSGSIRDAGNGYFPGSSPPTSKRGAGLFGLTGPPSSSQSQRLPPVGSAARESQVQNASQYPFDMGDDSYYDELIDPDPRKHVEFPFNVHILEMSTLDLINVHQLKRNQPIIKVFCDTFYSETKICAEYTDVTYFRELNWIFPVKEKSIFKITVSSRDKEIGSTRVDLNNLKSIPFDQFGNREVVLSFGDDKGRAAGKVRLIVKLSNAAINEYDQSHYGDDVLGMDGVSVNAGAAGGTVAGSYMGNGVPLHPSSSSKRRGSNAVTSQIGNNNGGGGGASVAGGASVPGVSYGKDFEYLLQSQVEAANELSEVALLQLVLTGIAVIDLRAVHTFAPNSPSVNLACGKVVATTTAAENAGKMANWEDLNIAMPLDRTATLRVLISSRDKVIGQVTITRAKLLGGRKNQKGFYVLFGELENNGKIAGKIKFVYSLEDPSK